MSSSIASSTVVPTAYAGNHQNGYHGTINGAGLIKAPRAPKNKATSTGSILVSIEAERALIGTLIGLSRDGAKQRAALDYTFATIEGVDIKSTPLRWFYNAIVELDESGEAINSTSVLTHLEGKGLLDDGEHPNALPEQMELPTRQLLNKCAAQAYDAKYDYEKYANAVRTMADARRAETVLVELTARIQNGDVSVLAELGRLNEVAERETLKKGPQGFTAAELMRQKFPAIPQVIPGFLPKGVTLLCGAPKARKSWAALGMALAIAQGGYIFGSIPAPKAGALCLCLEDTDADLQERLRGLLQGNGSGTLHTAPDNLHLFSDWPDADHGGLSLLRRWLKAHPDVKYVVADTLQVFRAQQSEKGNAYQQDYAAVRGLKDVADECGVALVAIHHTTKLASDDPFSTISGTYGIYGAADGAMVLQTRGEEMAVLHCRSRRIKRDQKIALRWDEQLCQWNAEGDADLLELSEVRQTIVEYLRGEGGSIPPHRIARDLQMKDVNVRNLLGKMLKDGQVVNDGGKYRLPRAHETPNEVVTPITPITLVTPITPFAEYQGDFNEVRVADVLDGSGNIAPDELAQGVTTVNGVIGVTTVIAQKRTLEQIAALKLDWRPYASAHLHKIRDFCWHWAQTYPDFRLTQRDVEDKLDDFLHSWPNVQPNCPPWLMKARE